MKCHYEILGVSTDCSSDDLKKAYRKLALEWHPDKNLDRLNEATETFQLIQQAYEILIDPQERAWYDRHKDDILRGGADEAYKDDCLNVYQYFNASCYKGFNDDEKGFYTTYRHVFETIANEDRPFLDKEDEELEVPHFGYSNSSYEEVVHNFYAYWQSYCTSKSFSWVDKYDLSEARKTGAGRQVIRMMEKENKKLRDQQKKARNEEVRELVAFVRKRDKRVQAHKKKEEERKIEKAKRAEEIRRQQVLERNKYFENSKESELLSLEKEKFEEKFSELENSVDAAFGTNTTEGDEESEEDALYCVACEKDFRSEKAMRNHENSKKHKENLVLLKYLMEEEERALKEDSEIEDAASEEDHNSKESENEETCDALLEELIKSSSKSKKKKKKNKPVLAEPTVSVQNESDSELCSKVEEIIVDDCPGDTENIETKTPPKINSIKKKVKKVKANIEKVPTEDCDSDKDEEEKPATHCETCNVDYKSRNKLFAHLKESGHAVYKNDNSKHNTSSASVKKRKKKKC